ncbi:MAG: flavodoxin family protein [Solobacterium sp.]|nr:flavodoxin family protein [Solobacterium sp.]
MKVLLINASPHEHGHNHTAAAETAVRLKEHGIGSEIYWLGQSEVHACLGCDACMKIDRCIQDDDQVNALAEKMIAADGFIVFAPVYFGGPNGALCNAFDRIFYSRTVKNQLFHGKPGGAVTVCNTMGAETALMGIYRYYNTCQMPIVSAMGFPTLTMEMVRTKNERFYTVVNAVADNMAELLDRKDNL